MRRASSPRFLFPAAALLATAWMAAPAAAAGVFFAGGLDGKGEFVAATNRPAAPCFTIRFAAVAMAVSNRAMQVESRETVLGHIEGSSPCLGLFALPAEADRESAKVVREQAGRTGAVPAEYRTADQVRPLLESIARATGSAAILALSGRPMLVAQRVALAGEADFVLSYRQPVVERQGVALLRCALPAASFARAPVSSVSLTAALHDDRPLRSLFSPSHECDITRAGQYDATVRMSAANVKTSDEFLLSAVADPDELGLRVLACRESDKEDGFFLLMANPSSLAGKQKTAKDIVFVLDISGSMRGEKMEQARSAVEYCLDNLNPGDRFNVIAFSTRVTSFRDDLVERSDPAVRAAKAFLDDATPNGQTNIGDALARGLAGAADARRPRFMIFLTDGTPTVGERSPDAILGLLQKMNASKTRIFVMGVGHDVHTHLLDQIAELSGGAREYVAPDEEIDVKVAALYNRLSHPVLADPALDFGELKVSTVFPRTLPAIFRGSQLLVAGRYSGGGRHAVTLKGLRDGEPQAFAYTTDFPEAPQADAEFIAPIWAARCIGFYLQEMRLHGEKDELVAEVVKLSRKYGIVTEYTEFLTREETARMSPAQIAGETRRRMDDASKVQSGAWAFNQTRNDQALQERVAANQPATFVDRRGDVKEADDSLRQVGGKAFVRREGRWVEAAEEAEPSAVTRVIKKFSREYFDLVGRNRKFAEAQALDAPVTVNVENQRIEVRE